MKELDAFHEGGRQLIRHLMRCNVGTAIENSQPVYLCDKTAFPLTSSLRRHPDQFRYVSLLQEYFPDAKKILLIRDIRDVVVSHSEWKVPESRDYLRYYPLSVFYFLRALNNWCRLHERWLEDMEGDKNSLVIQYADLKQNFRRTLEKIFQFIELDVDAEFIEDIYKNYYSIESKNFRDENDERGYAFFRGGREGDWREKFGPIHKIVVTSVYESRINKLLSSGRTTPPFEVRTIEQ
jgi:hypothetical protein